MAELRKARTWWCSVAGSSQNMSIFLWSEQNVGPCLGNQKGHCRSPCLILSRVYRGSSENCSSGIRLFGIPAAYRAPLMQDALACWYPLYTSSQHHVGSSGLFGVALPFWRYLKDNRPLEFPFHLNSDKGRVGLCRLRNRDYLHKSHSLAQRDKLIEELLRIAQIEDTGPHLAATFL